ncbi:MAG: hypothetical protein PHW11_08335 [Anaerolineaceae bacterium]|jgi:hypothetical protein|nr:hypothetical protein [Anaerolineaceae bacterium]MDD4042985.1 hypothetical protein [Anaerolineaceae bacterium]MDD4577522.1 hypothetical protein [Anaerolineaceae bacterium]
MKPRMRKIPWAVILVMIGLLSLTAITAAEDIVWPWSSEPGYEPEALAESAGLSNRLDEGGTDIGEPAALAGVTEPSGAEEGMTAQIQAGVRELQPDDVGYTGPVIEASLLGAPESGDAQAENIDWDAMIPEGAPDQQGLSAEPNWSDFHYFHVNGSAFRPRDSSVSWTTDGSGGCLVLSAGDPWVIFNLHLEIPNGARIDYLRFYFYDTSAYNGNIWITRYNNIGGLADLVSVPSSGNTGYGTTLSAELLHIVNSTEYAYLLNYRPYVFGATMQLCGMRVAYRLP